MIKISENIIKEAVKILSSNRDKEFLERCYSNGLKIFSDRLNSIKFENLDRILDAGCGFGQWSIAMSQKNRQVYSIENDQIRVDAFKKIIEGLCIKNIKVKTSSVEKMDYDNNFFDSIFCYSVLYYTDYKLSLKEFYRVLKPGGKLYFCTNGLGWYIHNIINQPNATEDFDPRIIGINAIKNTINYLVENVNTGEMYMNSRLVLDNLKETGFKDIICAGEGNINLNENRHSCSFFEKEYNGEEGVYEILCTK